MTDNKYWIYLEEIRRSGVTNMFGAIPYLQNRFGLSHKQARDVLAEWMINYNQDDYEQEGEEMSELDKLEVYLKEHGIPYVRKVPYTEHDWNQIVVPSDKKEEYEWDAICHFGSYGYEKGLIEIMGSIVDKKRVGDEVEGWLTAEDVIERIERKEKEHGTD